MTILVLLLLGLFIVWLLKGNKISTILFMLYAWILFAYSSGNADFINYEYQYSIYNSLPTLNIRNIGFKFACYLGNSIGLDYRAFLMIEAAFAMAVIAFVLIKYCKNKSFVLVLYIIFPFIIEVTQVRSTVSEAFVLLGIAIYIDGKIKDNNKILTYILFAGCILIAALYHVGSFAYLLLLALPLVQQKNIKLWGIAVAILEIVILTNFKVIALLVTSESNIYEYFSKSTSLLYVVVILALIVFAATLCYLSGKCEDRYTFDEQNTFESIIFKINLLMLVFAPLCCVASEFFRLYWCIFFLDYILVGNEIYTDGLDDGIRYRNCSRALKWRPLAMLGISILSNFMFIYSYMNTVILPFFNKNLLF